MNKIEVIQFFIADSAVLFFHVLVCHMKEEFDFQKEKAIFDLFELEGEISSWSLS